MSMTSPRHPGRTSSETEDGIDVRDEGGRRQGLQRRHGEWQTA
jgi:hypothetical protein